VDWILDEKTAGELKKVIIPKTGLQDILVIDPLNG
jgi:hypothetical protein